MLHNRLLMAVCRVQADRNHPRQLAVSRAILVLQCELQQGWELTVCINMFTSRSLHVLLGALFLILIDLLCAANWNHPAASRDQQQLDILCSV